VGELRNLEGTILDGNPWAGIGVMLGLECAGFGALLVLIFGVGLFFYKRDHPLDSRSAARR
jgi:hypothetical protein